MSYDILIKNAYLVSMDAKKTVISKAFIGINEDSISYIGKKVPEGKFDKVIDAKGNIVMPGLINSHTHSPMSVYRGLADDLALFDWLNNHIWPVEREFVTEENVETAAELAFAEMIRSGTTTFSDMYFITNAIEKKAREAGIRAVLGEVIIDIPVPFYKVTENFWSESLKKYKTDGIITRSIAPHSPYSCSKKLLKKIKTVSEKNNVVIHTHISETQDEVEHIRKKYGVTPVEYLDRLNFLDDKTIAVHCVVLSDSDINIFADRHVNIVHCPQSNLKLGSGIARISEMKKAGLNIALGTDGPASNNTLDMFSEMKTAAILHKGINNDPTLLKAPEVLEMATVNGAKALGLNDLIGSLETGKKADIIIVSTDFVHMKPLYDPYSHLVYCAKGSDVDTVIINGKIVMEDRKLITIDENTLMKKVKSLSASIKKFKSTKERK